MNSPKTSGKYDLLNASVLFSTPILAAVIVPLFWINTGFTYMDWVWFGIFMVCTGLGITGGYHRLWSHKAYDAHFFVKLFYAYWGACATQNSILKWSADHRDHHKHVDNNEKDPYSAKKGFWWSHMGWIINKKDRTDYSNVKDLQKDKIVMWQHNNYLFLTLFSNFAVPLGLGYATVAITGTGSIWGPLVLAGLLRFVLNHHFTFFINSACHFFGTQPYSNKDTSRDNFVLALVTYGEGYHNFHHTFQADYRNGIKWYHFDPTKWLVKGLSFFGLTSNLRKVSDNQIMKQKLLHSMSKEKENMYERLKIITDSSLYQNVETTFNDWMQSLNEWLEAKQKYFRMCKDDKASNEERASLNEKQQALKEVFEAKKAKLMEIFQAQTPAAISI